MFDCLINVNEWNLMNGGIVYQLVTFNFKNKKTKKIKKIKKLKNKNIFLKEN